jgi:phosphatidylglycerophosphate synthase
LRTDFFVRAADVFAAFFVAVFFVFLAFVLLDVFTGFFGFLLLALELLVTFLAIAASSKHSNEPLPIVWHGCGFTITPKPAMSIPIGPARRGRIRAVGRLSGIRVILAQTVGFRD